MKKLSEIIATMGEIEFLNYASLEGRVFMVGHPSRKMQLRKVSIILDKGTKMVRNEFMCGVDTVENDTLVVTTYGNKWASTVKILIQEVNDWLRYSGHGTLRDIIGICYYLTDDPIDEFGNEFIARDLDIFEDVENIELDTFFVYKPLEEVRELYNKNK